MPFHDFRQFLDVMRQQGELVDINQPIALTDVGKALKHAYAKGRKATSFNKNGTEFPLVCGVYSSRKHALHRVRGRREERHPEGARRVEQSDRAEDQQRRRRALPGGRHHRRHRHPALSDPDLQPEGRRALHHARHRRVEGPGDRRAGHRALPLPDPGQGHVLVLGAAVPPLRQEPDQVPADGRHAEGRADHRRRSDPRLHLPGAGARTRPTTGRSPAACAARRSSSRIARPATSRCRRRRRS